MVWLAIRLSGPWSAGPLVGCSVGRVSMVSPYRAGAVVDRRQVGPGHEDLLRHLLRRVGGWRMFVGLGTNTATVSRMMTGTS